MEKNIPQIQRTFNDVLSSTSTAKLSPTPNQAGTPRSPIRTKRGMIPSTYRTSRLAERNSGGLIDSIGFLYAGGRKCFFTKFRSAPVWTALAIVSMAFDQIESSIRTGQATCRKNGGTLYRRSSLCTRMAYGLSRSYVRS